MRNYRLIESARNFYRDVREFYGDWWGCQKAVFTQDYERIESYLKKYFLLTISFFAVMIFFSVKK